MTRDEQTLFVSTAVGLSFQLGFSSLLLAAAKQRGRDAVRWLSEFEERVVQDARRMTTSKDMPEAVVAETVETIVAEFREVFDSVRGKIAGTPSDRAAKAMASRCGLPEQHVHSCERR